MNPNIFLLIFFFTAINATYSCNEWSCFSTTRRDTSPAETTPLAPSRSLLDAASMSSEPHDDPFVIEHPKPISVDEWAEALKISHVCFVCQGPPPRPLGYASTKAHAASVIIVDNAYAEALASPAYDAERQSFIFYFQDKVIVFVGCNQTDIEKMSTDSRISTLFLKYYITIGAHDLVVQSFWNKDCISTISPLPPIYSHTGSPKKSTVDILQQRTQTISKKIIIEGTEGLIAALLSSAEAL